MAESKKMKTLEQKMKTLDKVAPYITEEEKKELQKIAGALRAALKNAAAGSRVDPTTFIHLQERWQIIREAEKRYIEARGPHRLLADAKSIIKAISKEDFLEYLAPLDGKAPEDFRNCYCYIRFFLTVQIRALTEEKIRPYIEKRVISFGYELPEGLEIPLLILDPDRFTLKYAKPEPAADINLYEIMKEAGECWSTPNSLPVTYTAKVINAGPDVVRYANRKEQLNHGANTNAVIRGETALCTYKTKYDTVKIEFPANKFMGGRNQNGKMFEYALIKINEQAVHNGELQRDYVTFPLRELVDIGLYKNMRTARCGFETAMDALTDIKVGGDHKPRSRKESRITVIGAHYFRKGTIKGNQCYILLESELNWNFIMREYYTWRPIYYFKLPNRPATLLRYICEQARKNAKSIKKNGYIFISFRDIQAELHLPDIEETENPYKTIIEPIENATEEIEEAHKDTYDNMDLSFHLEYVKGIKNAAELSYDEIKSMIGRGCARRCLEEGRIKVFISGELLRKLIQISDRRDSKIEQARKRHEKAALAAETRHIEKNLERAEKEKAEAADGKIQ